MDDPGQGWQTVMPTSYAGMKRLAYSQLEECERKILDEWEASRQHWSGMGKHLPLDDYTEAKRLHKQFKLACDTPLGAGTFGVVQKVQFHSNSRSVCLARKQVRLPYRNYPIHLLREEANVMEKLAHEHIVKLVGTYCIQSSLYLLLWPVAVCNLDVLIADIDCLRTGQGDQEDIVCRLRALDLRDLDAVKQPRSDAKSADCQGNCPIQYLRQIMGCVTRAVAYCHNANIRHLDLKPSNILLNPGRVYLADFGIAQDVHDRENTMTRGSRGTPKWRAPELQQSREDWSMKAADVYSLGMVLLNISTAIHYGPLGEFDDMLSDMSRDGRVEKLSGFLRKLEGMALATHHFDDVHAPTFGPKHTIRLVSRMVAKEPSARPAIRDVDTELVELGGIDQVYHFQCCKRSSRFVTKRMDAKLRAAVEERNRLQEERDRLRAEHDAMAKRLQVLEAKDVTYESRILHERNSRTDHIAKLQSQLDKERAERKSLETLVAQLQHGRRQHRLGTEPQTGGGCPSAGGSTSRMRSRTDAAPAAGSLQGPLTTRLQQPSPVPSVARSPQPSYSQAAAAAKAISSAPTPRRDSLGPSPLSSAAAAPQAPGADLAGYPLRSLSSRSRLPRAVNPATPIRSNTPLLNRDPSSTDSTQYSMASSIFDRRSLSKASLAETSVAGTPSTVNNSAILDMKRPASPTAMPAGPRYEGRTREDTVSPGTEHGLGLGLTDPRRRESITSSVAGAGAGYMQDAASVASSAGVSPGAVSPVLRGSELSYAPSPATRSGARVPALPTGKSWAEVARREKRG